MIGSDNEMFSCLRLDDERGYGKLVDAFREQVFLSVPSWSPDSKHLAFVSNSEKY